jgi:hypothetical protein
VVLSPQRIWDLEMKNSLLRSSRMIRKRMRQQQMKSKFQSLVIINTQPWSRAWTLSDLKFNQVNSNRER